MNPYQQMHRQAFQGPKKTVESWDLLWNGQTVKLGVKYPIAVQEKKNKIALGWNPKLFTIKPHK